MLFACSIQWLQATAAIFYSDYYRSWLMDATGFPEFVTATWLSLIGIFVLALGMRAALLRRRGDVVAETQREIQLLNPSQIASLYLPAFVVASILGKVASTIPGLAQPIFTLIAIK